VDDRHHHFADDPDHPAVEKNGSGSKRSELKSCRKTVLI
jgi:hypothetical protein